MNEGILTYLYRCVVGRSHYFDQNSSRHCRTIRLWSNNIGHGTGNELKGSFGLVCDPLRRGVSEILNTGFLLFARPYSSFSSFSISISIISLQETKGLCHQLWTRTYFWLYRTRGHRQCVGDFQSFGLLRRGLSPRERERCNGGHGGRDDDGG